MAKYKITQEFSGFIITEIEFNGGILNTSEFEGWDEQEYFSHLLDEKLQRHESYTTIPGVSVVKVVEDNRNLETTIVYNENGRKIFNKN